MREEIPGGKGPIPSNSVFAIRLEATHGINIAEASGVTVVVACPGYTNASGLYVFHYNGQQWVLACDPAGNVQPGGVGWMVPGSRVNHNGKPAWIEIKVYHASAVM